MTAMSKPLPRKLLKGSQLREGLPASSTGRGDCCCARHRLGPTWSMQPSPGCPVPPHFTFHQEPECDTLEHRIDVAAITMFHKTQEQSVSHLAGLHHPPRVTTQNTRTHSNGCQHQLTFSGRVSRSWNLFTAVVSQVKEMNTQCQKK